MRLLLWSMSQTAGWIILFASPWIVILGLVARQRRAYQAEAKEPFTEMPLRPAGESSRLKGEEFAEDALGNFMVLVGTSAAGGLATILTPAGSRLVVGLFSGVLVVVVTTLLGRKILRALRKFWDYRLGALGERLVGEELSQLLAYGYRVFHDVPFDHFNIDHAVVGAAGVFVVETKTFRKRTKPSSNPRHEVSYDGQSLRWPWGEDNRALDQAERNAAALSDWLTRATGERVSAKPFVTFPGWWVDRTSRGPARVTVVSSKGLHRFFPVRSARPIAAAQVQRMVYLLTERCRVKRNSPATR